MCFRFFFLLFLLIRSKRNIFADSKVKYNLRTSHSIDNGSTGKSPDNFGVCLFIHTKLSLQYWESNSWAKKFLSYAKQVLISSILRQCAHSSCPSIRSLYLLINAKGNNSEFELFIEDIGQMINIRVWRDDQKYSAMIEKIVDQHDCNWLSSVYIDADGVFLDGYFDYVSSELPRKLAQTLTMDGISWRGAVFGSRSLSRLTIGKGRCGTKNLSLNMYSGSSQGQGFLLRRDIWEKMGRLSRMRRLHSRFLRDFRNLIMAGIGFEDYQSHSCVGSNLFWTKSDKQIDFENIDAANTRIMFIDMSLEMSTAAVLIESPLSSHFQWNAWQDLPVCGDEQKKVIQGEFPKNIEYILDIVDSVHINVTFEEACRNNAYDPRSRDCSKVAGRYARENIILL